MEEKDIATKFAALAQSSRIGVLRLLASHNETGMAAGRLAERLDLAPSTLSFHLSALEQAGLVVATRQGRRVVYKLQTRGLRTLFTFLAETCGRRRAGLARELVRLLPEATPAASIMMPAFNVLFLCTRNSARSIIAEAILDKIGAGRFRAYSAGSDPAGQAMPIVVERLQALGHDVSAMRSKSWEEFTRPDAPRLDFIIAMCDTLENQRCPDFGGQVVTASWPFPDPDKFEGSATERATMINALYAMIRRRLEIFVNLPFDSLDRMALKVRLDELADHNRVETTGRATS